MFDFSTLITNRSASDLENLRALLSTPVSDWTAEQMAQFNQAISKGAYNYTDLNRVTQCMEYLDETLKSYGYETGYQPIIVHPEKPPPPPTLPEGYTELEYIESTGTQYIDTGFKPTGKSRVICDFLPLSTGMWIYGARHTATDNTFMTVAMSDNYRSDYNNDYSLNIPYDMKSRVTIDKNMGTMTIGSQSVSYPNADFNCNYNLYVFAGNSAGSPSTFSRMKLYLCQVYDNGTLIRNFVPCQDPTGNVGLYDLVNAQFYGNAGTGTFTAGPEVPQPEPEPPLDPYTWYEADIPTASQLAQYLSNVLSIWSTIMGDPTLPETMVNLTQEGANQIEAALIEINTAIEQIIAAMARSNSFTFWSGNRPFPTAYSNPGRNWAELDAMGTSWRNWQVASWYLLLYGNLEAEGDVT